jgi:hypothetical protein
MRWEDDKNDERVRIWKKVVVLYLKRCYHEIRLEGQSKVTKNLT